jgi:hypothetical protein
MASIIKETLLPDSLAERFDAAMAMGIEALRRRF